MEIDCERIQLFIEDHLDIEDFCIFLLNSYKEKYAYKNLEGGNQRKRSQYLVNRANTEGDLPFLVFYLALYCIDRRDYVPSLLREKGINNDIEICQEKFLSMELEGDLTICETKILSLEKQGSLNIEKQKKPEKYSEICSYLLKKIKPDTKPIDEAIKDVNGEFWKIIKDFFQRHYPAPVSLFYDNLIVNVYISEEFRRQNFHMESTTKLNIQYGLLEKSKKWKNFVQGSLKNFQQEINQLILKQIDEFQQKHMELFQFLLKIIEHQKQEKELIINKINRLKQEEVQHFQVIAQHEWDIQLLLNEIKQLKQEQELQSQVIENQKWNIRILLSEINELKHELAGISQETKIQKQKNKQLLDQIYYLEQTQEEHIQEIEQLNRNISLILENAKSLKREQSVIVKGVKKYLKGVLRNTWIGLLNNLFQISGFGIPHELVALNLKQKLPSKLVSTWIQLTQPQQVRYDIPFPETTYICVGIDLGTTYSTIAVPQKLQGDHIYIGNDITIIKDGKKQYYIPSVVAKDEEELEYVGQPAKDRVGIEPAPITSIKRRIGEDITLNFGRSYLLPEKITAKILTYLRNFYVGYTERIDIAVISVPVHFNLIQREKTAYAAKMAELGMVGLIEDPVAAALMYEQSYKYHLNKSNIIMTYDLGGGTFETALLQKQEDSNFKIIAFRWDTDLNGENIDKRLAEWIANKLEVNIQPDSTEMKKILLFAEKVKISLIKKLPINHSRRMRSLRKTLISFTINLETFEGFTEDDVINSTRMIEISRRTISMSIDLKTFEGLIEEDINETIQHCRELLEKTCIKPQMINDILLIGGNTHIPLVSRKLKGAFKIQPKFKNPELCVAAGAAIMAKNLNKTNPYYEAFN